MDSDRLNRWLTLGANLGVLVGLGALIVEIDQSNKLALANIEQVRSDGLREWRQEIVTNDHIAALLSKVNSIYPRKDFGDLDRQEQQRITESTLSELSGEDLIRYRNFVLVTYWDYENLFFQYKRGLISEEYWLARGIRGILSSAPQWKAVTGGNLPYGRPEFNEEVERLLLAYPKGRPDLISLID